MSDVMDFINSAGSGFDSFQFDNVGDKIDGTLISEPRIIEKRNDRTGALDKILVLELHTADGRDWTLMCGLGGRVTAIREALTNANAPKLQIGGRLVMQYTGDGAKQPGKSAPKFYAAAYVPPAPSNGVNDLIGMVGVVGGGVAPAAPPAQPAPQQAPPAVSVSDLLG